MSSSYERMNYITSFGFSLKWRRQFVESFQKSNEVLEIMDLLTGMGETWDFIAERFPNSKITALDFSEGMIKFAEEKNSKRFNGKVKILNEDILKNDLPDNHYDFVFCGFGLKTFDEEQLMVFAKEVQRILKYGGRLSFVDVSEPQNKLLKMAYGFYLQNIIPILGKLFLGDPENYRMLWNYTQNFKNAKKASKIFEEVGLKLQYKTYFYGCASGFDGEKQPPD